MNLTTVVRQLRQQRNKTARDLEKLDNALATLSALDGLGRGLGAHGVKPRKGHKMSASARKRIAAAQRARWAKIKAGKKAA